MHPKALYSARLAAAALWSAAILACSGAGLNTSVVEVQFGATYTYPDLTNVVAIAAGGTGWLALTEDGQVRPVALYPGSFIVDDLPPGLSNIVMVSAGDEHGLALHADGTVTSWGGIPDTNTPAGLTNFLSVDCGWRSTLGLLADGRVALWGFWYIDTNYPAGLTNVVDVSAGYRHYAGLRGDGTVIAWGDNSRGAVEVPAGLSNVIAISCGGYHTLALRRDGTVIAWGDPDSGVTNVPAAATNVIAIAGGTRHDVALRKDGRMVVWGKDMSGTPINYVSDFSNVVAIAAGHDYSLALVSPNTPFPAPKLTPPQLEQGRLRTCMSTVRGRRYFLEQCADLAANAWETFPVLVGSGATNDLSTACGTNTQKYLRVRSQQ